MALKDSVQKHGLSVSLFGILTAGLGTLQSYYKMEQEKEINIRQQYEIFVSNYQDEVNCRLDSLKINKCE